MYKKTIKYKDFFDKERTEDFYFHLTEKNVMQWVTTEGDYTLDKLIQKLIDSNNGKEIMSIMEDLIDRSYGEISLDGREFIQNDEILAKFKATNAYSQLFVEFVTDGEEAARFIAGIIPKKLETEIQKMMSESPDAVPDEVKQLFNVKSSNVKPSQPILMPAN